MRHYLLSVYQPEDEDHDSTDVEEIDRRLEELHQEMLAAEAWVFAAGLHGAGSARVVRVQEGQTEVTDGPYVQGTEHLGGFTIIAAEDLEAAVGWGQRLAEATTLPIEVRAFQEEGD